MDDNDTSTLPRGAWLAIAAVVVLAGALTWRLMDDQSPRSPSADSTIAAQGGAPTLEDMQREAEAANDAEAWQRLGLAYFNANRFAEAASAYEQATQVAPDSAVLWSALGEALVMASETDPMPDAASAAFRRAVELDAAEPRARYYRAVEKDLAQDHEGAIADWLALLADTPAGAPWETDLVRTITQVGQINDIAVAARIEQAMGTRNILPAPVASGIPGPTQEQMAAASSLSPNQQQDMAEQMVSRLAARLEDDPRNVDGWIMLMRSYRTLGRDGQARDALETALENNPDAQAQLRAAAEALGM